MQSVVLDSIANEILALKKERNAVILAHNYQLPEVQDIADFVGDSLGLSHAAAKTKADVIVFCGVHFMAETASIICPEKKVLIPDLEAGCSLSDTITAEQLRTWKEEHPDAVVVSYINTTAEVKAESDYCCTSTNALKIIQAIPPDKEILFLPDIYLGTYAQTRTGRKMHIWPGACHVHAGMTPEMIMEARNKRPQSQFLIHPECGCVTSTLYYMASSLLPSTGTHILSTEGIIRHAHQSPASEFVVATETGILHRLRKENPSKIFYPISEESVCKFMKKITLEKVLWALQDMVYEVKIPEPIASKARVAIQHMLELST